MTSEPFPAENRNGRCASRRCGQPPHGSLPLCEDHAWDLWAEMSAQRESLAEMAAAEERRRQWLAERIAKDVAKLEARAAGIDRTDPGIIYYIQIADKIKIGYTANLPERFKSYPPMATLRATHPGTLRLEADMHAKFRKYLADRREWFYRVPELEEHIEQVRKEFKQDVRVTA